jgi:hypothetical protein
MNTPIALIAIALLASSAARAEQKPCSRIYQPVCALSHDGKRSTISNTCVAENAGATVLHDGKCGGGDMCSDLYTPVCAINPKTGKEDTFSNMCHAELGNAKVTHDGACKAQ